MVTLKAFESYGEFVASLRTAQRAGASGHEFRAGLLDGLAASELRRLVPRGPRRKQGAFFTPHRLAEALAEPLADVKADSTVVDPSCGAGDLLIAGARQLRSSGQSGDHTFAGCDLVPEFVEAAALRLQLLELELRAPIGRVQLQTSDGTQTQLLGTATHLLLNPPFGLAQPVADRNWSSGLVNSAAPFVLDCLERLRPGASVYAILPDVLRSGSRYSRWRAEIDRVADVTEIRPYGRFDTWTDVNVFILRFTVPGPPAQRSGPQLWVPGAASARLSDHFSVNVGPVVHNRDPHRGPWRPYLQSKGIVVGSTITNVVGNRRFAGRVVRGPFVVVSRTSSPSEAHRCRAMLVTDRREIAVDNHLLVLKPLDETQRTCRQLLKVLARPETSEWLDRRISCRHLTVPAVQGIPWTSEL